eukprot:2189770-Prymnesium_polylepis.2
MSGDGDRRRARHQAVRWHRRSAQLRRVLVAPLAAPIEPRPLFSPLRQIVQGDDLRRRAVEPLVRRRPERIFLGDVEGHVRRAHVQRLQNKPSGSRKEGKMQLHGQVR